MDQGDGTQRWNVTRSSGPMRARWRRVRFAKDLIVLDYGKSGNGFYEVNAIDGLYAANSPYHNSCAGQVIRRRAGGGCGPAS